MNRSSDENYDIPLNVSHTSPAAHDAFAIPYETLVSSLFGQGRAGVLAGGNSFF